MHHIHVKDVKGMELPGRVWKMLVGPSAGGCKNMVFGIVEFPADSKPTGHRHGKEEEIIYVISGRGEVIIGAERRKLETGVAVYIPPLIDHQVIVEGGEPLVLACVFSPPLIPGSYDQQDP